MENKIHKGGRLSKIWTDGMPINQKLKLPVLAMKLSIFLLAISLHVSAAVFSQQITISVSRAPLREVMQSISKQSGYNFLFKNSLSKEAKPVTITLSQVPVEIALEKIFEGQPFTYEIENKSVIIKKKVIEVSPIRSESQLNQIDLHGIVTDSVGKPLPRATIMIKGVKGKATSTDDNGIFTVRNAPDIGIVVISMVGFKTREIQYSPTTFINAILNISNSSLDEVKVIAYGTTTKRLSTSNISSIKAKDIAEQPNNNPILSLQGRVPGVYIQQFSGVPGSDVSVRVQGKNSIVNGTDPFYVIDGVPYTSSMLSPIGAAFGAGGGSPLNFINSADIESIEILKDADATAIYGSKAANGAILITTKKGTPGKTKFDVNVQSGWGKVPHFLHLLNTPQYLELRNEAYKNDGYAPGPADYDVNGVWSQTQTTNWQKELIGGTAKFNDVRTSLTGGSTNTQFILSGNYHRETTVTPGDFSDKKGSVSLNLRHKSENDKLQLQLTGNYLQDNNTISNFDPTSLALNLAPNAPAMYNTDGSINWAPTPDGTSTFISNPASQLQQKYYNSTSNLVSNLVASYEILPDLKIKSSFGYNKLETTERTEVPLTTIPPDFFIRERSAIYSNKAISSWIIEPQITYSKYSSIGDFNFLIGSTFQKNNSELTALQGTGYSSDEQLASIQSASSISIWNSVLAKYNYNAIFGRINYNLSNKYLVNFTMRRDGSSRFGSNNLFKNFFSVGGAWIFSEEKWIKERLSFLNFGKIKASYGTTGNDQIGDYRFLSLYSQIYGVTSPYQGIQPIGATGHSNPFIQWEETQKLNLGLDLGFSDSRYELSLNYYRNRSSNQLLTYPLAFVTGFSNVLRNIPAKIENSGLEALVNAHLIKTKDFKWMVSANLTLPRNKLVEFPNLETYPSLANTLIVGKPITITKVFRFAGVDPQTGVNEFYDAKGNKTTDPDGLVDNTAIVNTVPTLYGGIQNSFSYKGIELDILVQGVKQTGTNYDLLNLAGSPNNQPLSALQRWKQPGDMTTIQKANNSSLISQYFYRNSSDAGYSDASFLRLKNVSLSYSLPPSLLKKMRMNNLRIYLLGQNLLTITNYNGLDPEFGTASTIPPLRVYTVGLQLTL